MILVNNRIIEIGRYPDGTPSIIVEAPINLCQRNIIEWRYEPNEEMIFYYIARHVKSKNDDVGLVLPYIPNGRLDRVCSSNEVFTLKYFCELINSIGFMFVQVHDAHSAVALALLDRVMEIGSLANSAIEKIGLQPEKDIVFYPDEGAMKRYSKTIDFPYSFGMKRRDRGNIILEVVGGEPSKPFDVLIIDDICSRGRTFLHAAKKLKILGANKVCLYITHCENTILEGELINSGLLEKIYTTNSIFTGEHPLIEVI